MPDQVRTRSQLVSDFGDNTTGGITAQTIRNLLASILLAVEADPAGAAATVQTALTALGSSVATKANKASPATAGNLAALDSSGNVVDAGVTAASKANASTVNAHVANTNNPHAVTAAQVGAYTTSDVDTALAGKADLSGATFTGDVSGADIFGSTFNFGNGTFATAGGNGSWFPNSQTSDAILRNTSNGRVLIGGDGSIASSLELSNGATLVNGTFALSDLDTTTVSGTTPGQVTWDSGQGHFFGWNGSTWTQLDN